MRDDERYVHDGLDLRVEQERLLQLPVFNGSRHQIVPPELKVRRAKRQPNRYGFAQGGRRINVTIGANTTLDRFDLQEVLLHEDVHVYLQQAFPNEREHHGWRFWSTMDSAFQQAYDIDPTTLPSRTNRFHGRYANALRRAALVTNSDQVVGDIDQALVEFALEGHINDFLREHQLTSIVQRDPHTGEELGRWPVGEPQVVELRGATWKDIETAMARGHTIQMPNGDVRRALTQHEFNHTQMLDDDGQWMDFTDPNEPRGLNDYERAFLVGELDDDGYARPAVIDLPEPLKNIPEPEHVPGGPARISLPEYAPEPRLRRSNDAPRTGDRFGIPIQVEYRQVTRGSVNVYDRDRAILDALNRNGPMTARELAGNLGITDGQARHATSRLRRHGRIEKPIRGGPWVLVD